MAATPVPASGPRWLTHLPQTVKKALEPLSPYERAFVQLYCSECRGNGTLAMQMLRTKISERKLKKAAAAPSNRKRTPTPPATARKLAKPISYSTAATKASQMLIRPHVRIAINAWMEAFAMSAAEVTAKIGDLAGATMAPFLAKKRVRGKEVMVLQADDPAAWSQHMHWVKKIETSGKTGQIISLELHDAFAAQKEIAKILKLSSDQPILALNLHFQQLSNEEILAELMRAHAEIAQGKYGEENVGDMRTLLGQPIAVVDQPDMEDSTTATVNAPDAATTLPPPVNPTTIARKRKRSK